MIANFQPTGSRLPAWLFQLWQPPRQVVFVVYRKLMLDQARHLKQRQLRQGPPVLVSLKRLNRLPKQQAQI